MKRILCCLLVLLCCMSCCLAEGEDDIILGARDSLAQYWKDVVYSDSKHASENGHLEIKWTRVVYMKDELPDDLDDSLAEIFDGMVSYVEFFLLSDYFGSAPYYGHAGLYDCVACREDGSFEVLTKDPMDIYRARTYNSDFSDFIESISDRENEFNAVYNLLND